MIAKKTDWLGLVFLLVLVGFVALAYLMNFGGAVISYPAPAFLAGVFGIGLLVQSLRLANISVKNDLPVFIFAVLLFAITVLMAGKDSMSPEEVVNGFAVSFSVFVFFWYIFAVYKAGLVVDEVHIFSLSIVSALTFLDTSSWWWYLNLAFVVLSLFALIFHGKMHGFIRFLLFVWFTAINALILWVQFGETYKKIFSVTEVSAPLSIGLVSEMFAAGLAAPVALFPLFHALLLIVLGMLVLLTLFRRHRIKELTDHLDSIVGSIENISLKDWRVISVVVGVTSFSVLGVFGVIEIALAINIAYLAIGLWMSFRIRNNSKQSA